MYVRTYVCIAFLVHVRKLLHVGICFVMGSTLAWRQLHVRICQLTHVHTYMCSYMCLYTHMYVCTYAHTYVCFNSEMKMKRQGEVMSVITLFGL